MNFQKFGKNHPFLHPQSLDKVLDVENQKIRSPKTFKEQASRYIVGQIRPKPIKGLGEKKINV